MRDAPSLERIGDLGEPRHGRGPIVERRLQRRHDSSGTGAARQVLGDDDEAAVAPVFIEASFMMSAVSPSPRLRGEGRG